MRYLLSELVDEVAQKDLRKSSGSYIYVDIASIDSVRKEVQNPVRVDTNSAPSRARQCLEFQDVLVSTVRPNLNAVAWVPKQFHGAIGSTGFCVLRPRKQLINSKYLYYFCQHRSFVNRLTQIATGASYPAVTDDEILETEIDLPSVIEQEQIVAILDFANDARRLLDAQIEHLSKLCQGMFLDAFKTPANYAVEELVSIESVLALSQYGTSDKSNQAGLGYPILGMGNVTYDGRLNLQNYSYVELSNSEFEKLKLQRNDIIFNRTNSTEMVGKTALWEETTFDAVLASYLVKLQIDEKILPEYFVTLLNTPYFKKLFQRRCKKAIGQSNISPTLLSEFKIFVPKKSEQASFAEIYRKNALAQKRLEEGRRQAELLFQSRLEIEIKALGSPELVMT